LIIDGTYLSLFQEYLKLPGDPKCIDDIEKDLHRQFPFHEMFMKQGGYGYVINFLPQD
jgi:hypothetical protein